MRGTWHASIGIAALLASCSGTPAGGRAHCATARIGPGGGSVVGANGSTLMIAPGSLTSDVEVRLCVLELGRVPHQHSDMIEIAPTSTPLNGAVTLTMPVDDTTPDSALVEELATPSSTPSFSRPVVHTPGATSVTAFVDAFGDVRVVELSGADASVDLDSDRIDAPRPLAPLAVGPDLAPADYTCLGMRRTPAAGDTHPVTLRAIDWADGGIRASYTIRSASSRNGWNTATGTCTDAPDCTSGVTDAAGETPTSLRTGPVWFSSASSGAAADAAHTPFPTWVSGLAIDDTTTVLDVPALSTVTGSALRAAVGNPTRLALGRVLDCAGHPVQRARVVGFDALGSALSTPVRYGNGFGGVGTSRRTVADGLYAFPADGYPGTRIEAWGVLELGGPEVLIACDVAALFDGAAILDLRPLGADAMASCGTT